MKSLRNMSATRRGWYDIQNRATGPTQLMIYDDIGNFGISANDFVDDLKQLNGDLEVHINSKGGDVFEGITIYNHLVNRPDDVSIIVDGVAASIASVIAMAATKGKLSMAPNAAMFIHEAHAIEQGNSADLTKMANLLDKTSDNIASIYAERTGIPAEQWREAMRAETWYSAQEAKDTGLADSVLPARGQSNSISNDADFPHCELLNVKHPHGDVPYADPGYLDANGEQVSKSGKEGVARYPIDEEHVKAAWSYINQEKNASQYSSEQLASIKSKIKSAMKKFGHDVADNSISLKIQATLIEVLA